MSGVGGQERRDVEDGETPRRKTSLFWKLQMQAPGEGRLGKPKKLPLKERACMRHAAHREPGPLCPTTFLNHRI